MPELPEVQTVVSDLQDQLAGAKIEEVIVNDAKVWHESTLPSAVFMGAIIKEIYRYGKYIVLVTSAGDVLIHLRMTGKVLPVDNSAIPKKLLQEKSLQLRAHLKTSKGVYVFYDSRRFGTITAVKSAQAFLKAKGLAPEIYVTSGKESARKFFVDRATKSQRSIKSVLLDQSVILGPGNIYADEALHGTGIHPEQKANELTQNQLVALFEAVVEVMNAAINKRGTSAQNYLDVNGNPGVFKQYLRVYKREGLPCKKCKTVEIKRIKVGGRSSHYCPNCQKIC